MEGGGGGGGSHTNGGPFWDLVHPEDKVSGASGAAGHQELLSGLVNVCFDHHINQR